MTRKQMMNEEVVLEQGGDFNTDSFLGSNESCDCQDYIEDLEYEFTSSPDLIEDVDRFIHES